MFNFLARRILAIFDEVLTLEYSPNDFSLEVGRSDDDDSHTAINIVAP
jgi:hypothetical protein